ncbi:30S ribosomal protein 2 [Hibiscus syriacus]|uniref:30S ribosomal protein 2 n=1 Tax=Hibiscus syriacus TaxID=106335 RepID=A0A6A2ZXY6_HIBSY|nr:sister chromatid cohesion 1 protein 3-like [Hibiscus syriacus]KAE8696820.1 30S ribosomal protein 2 [Hibiscus syriacus]
MFYSHTFLSRKAPLGTVWCAAHLQHRLKKSHYTATDIPTTVDHIMFPEVPIALRMSGHLLLGVVRIYSKKVEYLYHDCNIILIGLSKVFAPSKVTLPEDAIRAQVHAITLPQTLDLDAMELDVDDYNEEAADNHLRNLEDITLADQIPAESDRYVAITFDDDIMMDDTSPQEAFHQSGSIEINDILNEPPETGSKGMNDPAPDDQVQRPSFQDPGPSNQLGVQSEAEDIARQGPSNQTQVLESVSNDSSQDFPEMETMRDAAHDFSTENDPTVGPDNRDDPTEVSASLEQVLEEKETRTPSLNLSASGELPMPFQQHSDPPASASNVPPEAFVDASPQLVIPPSPPPEQPRRRRRRNLFDEKLVLPNRVMKRALEDCSGIVRKRKKTPCSALGVWKLNNARKAEHMFNEPSLTGLSEHLCNMFKKDGISLNPQLAVLEEVIPEPTVLQSAAPTTEAIRTPAPDHRVGSSPASVPEVDMETECLRHDGSNASDNVVPEFGSLLAGSMPSPFRREDSPFSAHSLESELAPRTASTTNIPPSTGTHASEIPTPMTFLEQQSCLGNSGFSTIPEFRTSESDLYFLEEDSHTPTESGASQGVGSLSARTRAVAKYLRCHSPITPISEDGNVDLSLSKILEGKTRKICARMFFETLVLKSYGIVDVEQEEAYGDITLKVTPSQLSKADT